MSNSGGLASSAARGMHHGKRSADLFLEVYGFWTTKTEEPQSLRTGSALPGYTPSQPLVGGV
jgi:hypothetical protein